LYSNWEDVGSEEAQESWDMGNILDTLINKLDGASEVGKQLADHMKLLVANPQDY